MNQETTKVFSPGSMLLFRRVCKIRRYFTRAKICPLERTVGARQFKNCKCEICADVTETNTSYSTLTGDTLQINNELVLMING